MPSLKITQDVALNLFFARWHVSKSVPEFLKIARIPCSPSTWRSYEVLLRDKPHRMQAAILAHVLTWLGIEDESELQVPTAQFQARFLSREKEKEAAALARSIEERKRNRKPWHKRPWRVAGLVATVAVALAIAAAIILWG